MPKVLITTVPFADKDLLPIDLLKAAGVEYEINPISRKLKEEELAEMVEGVDALIAGTEQITAKVLSRANSLKLISRVGVGLDGVDLLEAESRGIQVSYTPEAPAPAVAELTVGLMLALLRSVHIANTQLHSGVWERHFGRRISEVTIGILGAGRIGGRVARAVVGLGASRILINDNKRDENMLPGINVEWVDKETVYREADVISLHLPLTGQTNNMIKKNQLMAMKRDAVIINTARGGIINERDLFEVMKGGHLFGAAVDVFKQEPYDGELSKIDRCILTSHMGSMSIDCRTRMEIEATQEVIRFFKGEPLKGVVPREEYDVQRQGI